MFLHVSLFGQSPEAEELTVNFPSLQVSCRSSFFPKGQPGTGKISNFHFSLIFIPSYKVFEQYFTHAYYPNKLFIVFSQYNLVVCKLEEIYFKSYDMIQISLVCLKFPAS